MKKLLLAAAAAGLLNLPLTAVNADFSKGEIYYSHKKFTIAAELLKKSLDADPLNAKAWFYMGNIRTIEKNYEEADRCFQKALDLDATAAVYYSYAGLKIQQKMPDVAEAFYKKTVSMDAAFYDGYDGLARVMFRDWRWPEAADMWEKVLSVKPDHPDKVVILELIARLRAKKDYAAGKRNEYLKETGQGGTADAAKSGDAGIDVDKIGSDQQISSKKAKSISDVHSDIDIVE